MKQEIHHNNIKYRPEIDGLRAVAVLSVLLFHAKFQTFSGGFVGVDIFFVISGYLITTIILKETNRNIFSIARFYERRARRILPALFTVIFISSIIVFFTFVPRDIKDFSQSLIAVITFSSNILFWLESGYWETSSELKPLLHTWSLAVEEQFYILFPIIIIALSRLKKHWTIISFILIIFISLTYAHIGSYTDPESTFYLLPTRCWELAIGATIAYYFIYHQKEQNTSKVNIFNNIFSITGVVLISYSILYFDEKTPFPSIIALLPTIGAALIIAFASHQTLIGKFLSNKAIVFIGLISYSTYLWHQPILAFARYNTEHTINKQEYIFLLIVALLLGYISWKYIETPFRTTKIIKKKALFLYSIIGSIFFILLGITGHLTNGFEGLWLQNKPHNIKVAYQLVSKRQHQNDFRFDSQKRDNNECQFNVPTINKAIENRIKDCFMKYKKGYMVFGDSHAIDLFGIIASSPGNHPFVVGITQEGCRLHNPLPKCNFDELLAFIAKNDYFQYSIYEQAGFYLLKSPLEQGSRELISNFPYGTPVQNISLDKLKINRVYKNLIKASSSNNNVIWFGPRIEPHISETTILKKGCNFHFKLRENQHSIFDRLDKYIHGLTSKTKKIHFISQNKLLKYKFPEDFMNCNEIYWSDGDHLSEPGERRFGKRINIKKLIDIK